MAPSRRCRPCATPLCAVDFAHDAGSPVPVSPTARRSPRARQRALGREAQRAPIRAPRRRCASRVSRSTSSLRSRRASVAMSPGATRRPLTPSTHRLGHAADGGGDHRHAGRHRLEQADRQRGVVGRRGEHRRALEQRALARRPDPAGELHRLGDAQALGVARDRAARSPSPAQTRRTSGTSRRSAATASSRSNTPFAAPGGRGTARGCGALGERRADFARGTGGGSARRAPARDAAHPGAQRFRSARPRTPRARGTAASPARAAASARS